MIDLYYAPDNASLIVRIVLEELGISYRPILVDRSLREQTGERYRTLNPNGLIPVCVIEGEAVFETAAIAMTLADRASYHGARHSVSLAPDIDSSTRAQFLKWLFYLSNTLHADLRLLFYPEKYVGSSVEQQKHFQDLTRDRLRMSLSIINDQYLSREHVYLFSDQPSIVDIYLAVCIRWLQLYPASSQGSFNVAQYTGVMPMVVRLQLRAAVIRACAAEGISGEFFSRPDYANPSEGSAV